jgi:hypothetical protein
MSKIHTHMTTISQRSSTVRGRRTQSRTIAAIHSAQQMAITTANAGANRLLTTSTGSRS